ncbi:hypothetical protein [Streptomyces flavofungini]|uniref:hypothetical protein n=1 Tax=Streptomyces flavofungini TaxID=68200 RepID=UPI00339D5A6C
MSPQAAALRRGGTVATRAVGLWLAPEEREQQARSSMSELIRVGVPGLRAHLDLWRETVVMAAGHANRTQQEEILGGVLERAEREPRRSRALRLVAASCQETMPSVPDALAARLDEAVARLVPPRRQSDVASLAAGGGVPLLSRLPPSRRWTA